MLVIVDGISTKILTTIKRRQVRSGFLHSITNLYMEGSLFYYKRLLRKEELLLKL